MDSTARNRPAHRVYRSLRPYAVLLGIAGAAGIIVLPAAAQAASRPEAAVGHTIAGRAARPLAASLCSKVSAASVAAIVGHSVPAPTANTVNQPATKKNFGVSGVLTICTFGAETFHTSPAALTKLVVLELDVTSKPLTMSKIEQATAKTSTASSKIKTTPYSGLGVPSFYFTVTSASITGEGIEGVVGTRTFSGTVFTKNLSESKLAALAKLAEKL